MGIVLGKPEAELLLVRTRNLSQRRKRDLSDRELAEIYFKPGNLPLAALRGEKNHVQTGNFVCQY